MPSRTYGSLEHKVYKIRNTRRDYYKDGFIILKLNETSHMENTRISGKKPSSVTLRQTNGCKRLNCGEINMPKHLNGEINGAINPQNLNLMKENGR